MLLDEDRFKDFITEVDEQADITHLWLVTDSEAAFARMRAAVPAHLRTGMLYRDYLRNFSINTEANVS